MIGITQDLKFKQTVVEYSFKYACRMSKKLLCFGEKLHISVGTP